MPLRNVATTFTIEQQRLEINALAGDVNNIATGATNVGSATTASSLAAGATGEDLTLSGTLTVNGTQTILNTATLEVEDKNIVIAKGSTTDAAASGGGITLKGADDKTISYSQTGDKWVSNKNFEAPNLAYTSGGQTFSGNLTIQRGSADNADLNIGATGTGEARIYLDASNGDFSGGDYAYFKQTDAGLLKIGNMNGGGIQFLVGEGAAGAGNALTVTNGGKVTIGNDHSGAATWDGDLVVANDNGGRISIGDTGSGERFDIAANGDINLYSYLDGDHISFWTTDSSGTFRRFKIQSNGNVIIPSGYLQIDPSDHDKLKLKVPSGSSDDWAYMTFWGEDGTRNAYVGTNAAGDVKVSRDGGCNLELGDNAIFNANVSDGSGNLRSIPQNATSAAYTLTASDKGKHVYHTSTGAITVPATSGVFDVGDAVTIVNGHASDSFEILSAGGVTIWLAGAASPTSGTRTLAVKGICTLICVSSNGYYISGAGLT